MVPAMTEYAIVQYVDPHGRADVVAREYRVVVERSEWRNALGLFVFRRDRIGDRSHTFALQADGSWYELAEGMQAPSLCVIPAETMVGLEVSHPQVVALVRSVQELAAGHRLLVDVVG